MSMKQYFPQNSRVPKSQNGSRIMQCPLSPKYDRQKGFCNQLQRKKYNQQKLARFDQYNSLLVSKAYQQMQGYQMKKDLSKKSIIKCDMQNIPIKNHVTKQHQSGKMIQRLNTSENKEKYLQQLKQKNGQLHRTNHQLRSHLKQLSLGVDQLEDILQQVELTHSKLKMINLSFNGLWILKDQSILRDELKEEKNTKETIQFQSDKKIMEIQDTNQYDNTNSELKLKNKLKINNYAGNKRNQDNGLTVNTLQNKFNKILKKIQNKGLENKQKYNQVHQLDKIQQQLDKLKEFHQLKEINRLKQTNLPKKTQQQQVLSHRKIEFKNNQEFSAGQYQRKRYLAKVKSLQGLIRQKIT